MKKNILYWSPFIDNVGTIKSCLNSALSISKYSKNTNVEIVNVVGEINEYKNLLLKNQIKVIDFFPKLQFFLPVKGFLKSRTFYFFIIIISLFKLIKLIKKNEYDYFIAHLITSLPILIFNFINTKTKLVLRISGYPKLNFLRKNFWKISDSKINLVTCPTIELLKELKNKNIFNNNKIFYLQDAILSSKNSTKQKNKHPNEQKNFIAVGRLTKQKNFLYLIEEFSKYIQITKSDEKLNIYGNGEQKYLLNLKIKKLNMQNNIFLKGYCKDIFYKMKDSKALILSSLWEEIGFVIVEAAFNNLPVISSNCPNGPSEFLDDGKNGILYQSNKKNALKDALLFFSKDKSIKKKKFLAKKESKKYTIFQHYLRLEKLLQL